MPQTTSADKKEASELQVARVFCEWYARTHNVPCTLVRPLKAPAPDVLIHVGTTDVATELARYREQGIYNQLHPMDAAFKLTLSDSFGRFGRNRLPRCTSRIKYREQAGRPGYYMIPPRHLWPKIGEELIALMRAHKKPRGKVMMTSIVFKLDAELSNYIRIDRKSRYVASETYPILSGIAAGLFFTGIRSTAWGDLPRR